MIKRELAKDEKLKNESWDRFLPKFKKQNIKQKKPTSKKKKDYTPFPPAQVPSKVDLQLESGEYFLSKMEKESRALAKKKEAQVENAAKKQQERQQAFIPPTEPAKKPTSSSQQQSGGAKSGGDDMSIEDLKKKFAEQGKKRKMREETGKSGADTTQALITKSASASASASSKSKKQKTK
ncbi:hypothetical protein HK102_010041 [Quaeritorhiza haematococci]|nr:hypothetical protein HK102_010041 [Quaeritorhiza haematococci]